MISCIKTISQHNLSPFKQVMKRHKYDATDTSILSIMIKYYYSVICNLRNDLNDALISLLYSYTVPLCGRVTINQSKR